MREPDTDDWRARAATLQNHGGIPERRSQAIALLETGLSHTEVAGVLGIARSGVADHVKQYRQARDDAEWLAEHGPEI